MHYYKFNIADWHLATSHLSLEEEAVYFKLINFYYDTEQPIPLETETVIRRLRLGSYSDTVRLVLSEFFILQENGWHHKRCDEEIVHYHSKAEKNKTIGKLGGRPRKNKDLQNNPNGFENKPIDNPNITLTTNHKPITNINTPNGFNLFWDAYGYKTGKPNAIKEWNKLNISNDQVTIDIIVEMAKKDKLSKPDNKYRKHPERWLKGHHWLDEVEQQKIVSTSSYGDIFPRWVEK